MKRLQTRILLVLFTMMLIPQGLWAQVPTTITQTFNANSITTVTEYQSTVPALSAEEGGMWSVSGSYNSPVLSYNSGIQFTLQHQNNPQAPVRDYFPVYTATFRPMTGSLSLVIDQIDLYFASVLQNVSIDAANAGFQVSGPTTTSDGIRYQLQASSSQSASGVFFLLTNGSYTSNETIVLKKIVMTGKVTLSAPYLSYSYDSEKAIFSNFTNYNGFLKGYYSIDYASASLADVTNTEYNGTGFGLQGPCTVTAYVQCGTAKSSNEIGTLFGFAESAMTTTYQPNGTVNAPNIVPELPNGATVAYSNNTNGTTAPTNPINSSTGVITINGADTESYSASYLPSPSPSGVTVLNQTNSNGAALSYKLGSFSLEVTKRNISDCTVSLSQEKYTYYGSVYTPHANVKVGTYSFNEGANGDYTVSSDPSEIKDAGTYTISITPTSSGRLTGSAVTKTFTMEALSIENAQVTLGYSTVQYTGSELKPTVTVALPGAKGGYDPPIDASNYTVSYDNNTNVGTATVTVTGKGNYKGSASAQFMITAKDLSGADISNIPNQTYTGSAITPEPTVSMTLQTGASTTTLTKGTDYTLVYASNTNVGTATITVSGKGNYSGTATKTFTIVKATPTVTAPTGKSLTYTGSAQALVNAGSTTAGTLQYSTDGQTYSTSIPSATNAGTHTVYYRVVGDANYNNVDAKSVAATIAKAAATISFASDPVNKTFGDAVFTNTLENKGDGPITGYNSSNTAVATVDANGKVTIVGSGDATITATVADGTNYTYATKTASYQLKVGTAALSGVSATGYTGTYDAKAHGISVTAPAGATVKYGESAGTYNLTASPTYTNAGTYTVYYQVTKANFTTVTGSQTVTISKAAATISFASAQLNKTFGDAAFTNTFENKGDGKVTYNSSNTAVATVDANGKVTIVGSGDATITATVADGTNYTYTTKTASYQLKVGTAALSGVSATGYTGTYDAKAHGISVTAPAGATVKYGESAGTYNLTASPTYTNAGTYTVYYQVTKANFTTVTGSQTVTISKAAATISFASAQLNKTFGDAAFTNTLENKGDGPITGYNSSNTAVATVDANGKVTIVGSGDATITATVADGTNYTYATKTASYQLKVGTAALSGVSATGYTGTYDAKAHGISVTAPAGATVKYGESAGTYNLTASPTYTNAGTYTVYYQVTKPNFTAVTGSKTVTITKANAQVLYVDYVFTTKIGETFNPPYLTLNPANLAVTYSSSDDEIATVDAQTGEVTLVSPGEVKIYAYFAGDANYNSAYDYYILTVLQRDIEPIDEDVVYMMDDEHFLYTDEDGHTKEVKLDNTIIYDILFTLNIDGDPSESDGYDETEHCIVLNHHMYDSRLYNLIFMGVEPGSKEYAEEYTGLTFKVPAGTGYVIIDSRTDGEHWMKVQIGDLAPVAFCHTDREKDYILYECEKDTWVHVYNGGLVSDVSMAPLHRAKKEKGQVRIYSITRKSSKAAGIERLNVDALESERWYDLQGNRIQRPTRKGLYILQGQKVVVK